MNIFKTIINLIKGNSSEPIKTKVEKQVEKETESKTKVEEPALVNNLPVISDDKKVAETKSIPAQETAKEIKAKVRKPQPQDLTQVSKSKPKYRKPKPRAKPIDKPTK